MKSGGNKVVAGETGGNAVVMKGDNYVSQLHTKNKSILKYREDIKRNIGKMMKEDCI